MSYEKQKTKADYFHCCLKTEKGLTVFLLGLNKEQKDEETIKMIFNSPLINYPREIWDIFFKLNQDNRQKVIKFVEKIVNFQSKKGKIKKSKFNFYYWDVFVDFLFFIYEATLFDIVRDMVQDIFYGNDSSKVPSNEERKIVDGNDVSIKLFYDRLIKLKDIKRTPRQETLNLIKAICAHQCVSFDLIRYGKGNIYTISPKAGSEETIQSLGEKYTWRAITKLINEDSEIEVKEIIMKLTGLQEDDIQENQIQIAYRGNLIAEQTKEIVKMLMEVLYETQ